MIKEFRISDYILAKISDTYEQNEFHKVNEQYVRSDDNDIVSTVWYDGAENVKHYINKVYNSNLLIDVKADYPAKNYSTSNCRILLRQGFDFTSVFGLLVVLKDMDTDEILISRLLTNEDFHISDSKELINGSFWIEESDITYPRSDNNLMMQVTTVTFADVNFTDRLGLILNYPNEFIPLIGEKPTPDFIRTTITMNESNFVVIHPFTTENKTLQKSILDYFGLELAQIDIAHVIKYGNEEDGYYALRVTNEMNVFNDVIIGLDFSPFKVNNNTSKIVTIFVSTEITVDNKLMKRENSISVDLLEIINPLVADMIGVPETIFPVNITEEQIIKNTVIQQNVHEKYVALNYPVFVQYITGDIIYENKNITFPQLNEDCYLITEKTEKDEEQTLISGKTSDGVYYFDLSQFVPIAQNTKYKIKTVNTKTVIGEGMLIVSENKN